MPTRRAAFRFQCHDKTLTFAHALSTEFFDPAERAKSDYGTRLTSVLTPIMAEHHDACLTALATPCEVCTTSASTKALQNAITLFERAEPEVLVLCSAVCDKPECEGVGRQRMQKVVEGVMEESRLGRCAVCGKEEGARKCSGCGTVAYCGTECQKMDWKRHKKACKTVAAQKAS